jgi:hypothetical protein
MIRRHFDCINIRAADMVVAWPLEAAACMLGEPKEEVVSRAVAPMVRTVTHVE